MTQATLSVTYEQYSRIRQLSAERERDALSILIEVIGQEKADLVRDSGVSSVLITPVYEAPIRLRVTRTAV